MTRNVTFRFEVMWDRLVFTNETEYVISITGDWNQTAPGDNFMSGRGQIAQMKVSLDNSDNRFSAMDTTGPLYNYIRDGNAYHVPVYLNVDVGTGEKRVFTGVAKIPRENMSSPGRAATVELVCRGREEEILQYKSSTLYSSYTALWDKTEADIIKRWLLDSGMTDTVDYNDASIDNGRFGIAYAWLDNESPIDDAWDLASSCGGWFYCDRYGMFTYDSVTNWIFRDVVHTIDPSTFGSLSFAYDDTLMFSQVDVEYSTREPGRTTDLWHTDELANIQPNGQRVITAIFSKPAYNVTGLRYDPVSSGAVNMSATTILVDQKIYAQRAEFTISNSHQSLAVELRNMRVVGIPLLGGPTGTVSRQENTGGWWDNKQPRVKSDPASVYIQGPVHAAFGADVMAARFEVPQPTYNVRNFPGDPELNLGDKVTIHDPKSMTDPITAHIVGIAWTLNTRGFWQNLKLVDASRIFKYAAGVKDGYFVAGTNTVGPSNVLGANLFY